MFVRYMFYWIGVMALILSLGGCQGLDTSQHRDVLLGQLQQRLLRWEEKVLSATAPAPDDWYGFAVAVHGHLVLVGAPQTDPNGKTDAGAALLFQRSGANWILVETLIPGDSAANDRFGASVALQGETALIGVPHSNGEVGAAYVFVRKYTSWVQEAKLIPVSSGVLANFGWSVSLDGETAVVGAPQDTSEPAVNGGSAYVFVRSASEWLLQAKLTASDPMRADAFGISLGVSGNWVIAGASHKASGAAQAQGTAYAFLRTGTTWTQKSKLTANDGLANDQFGRAVAIEGAVALIGAPYATHDGIFQAGAAYVFGSADQGWFLQEKLVANDAKSSSMFAGALALRGDRAVIGSPLDTPNNLPNAGSAYVFVREGMEFGQQSKLIASDAAAQSSLGWAVSLDDQIVAAGAYLANVSGQSHAGAAYAYINLLETGSACLSSEQCSSLFCVDGVCCDQECGLGSPNDCQACSVLAGASQDGACEILPPAHVCRAAAGACDLAESCNGQEFACPADILLPDGADCSDGLTCNGTEACLANVCTSQPIDCEDGNPCTLDSCSEPSGCTHELLSACCAEDAACDDGNECTIDRCAENSCNHKTIPGCRPGGGSSGVTCGCGATKSDPWLIVLLCTMLLHAIRRWRAKI